MHSKSNVASDQILTAEPFTWLSELIELYSPRAIAQHTIQLVDTFLSPASTHLVWAVGANGEHGIASGERNNDYQIQPAADLTSDQLALKIGRAHV